MKVKKPATVKWIIALSILRMVIAVMLVIITAFILAEPPEAGFFKGFAEVLITRFGLDDPYTESAYALGRVIGILLIPFIIIVLEYLFVTSRKRAAYLVMVGLDLLITIGTLNLPLMPVILLVLGLTKSAKFYFKGETEKVAAPDVLDSGLNLE